MPRNFWGFFFSLICTFYSRDAGPSLVQLLGIIISATCRWRRMAARRHGRLLHSRGRPGGSGTANGTERGGGGEETGGEGRATKTSTDASVKGSQPRVPRAVGI